MMLHRLGCQCTLCAQTEYSNTMLNIQRSNWWNQWSTWNNIVSQKVEIHETFDFTTDAAERANDRTQMIDEDGDVKIQY